MSGPITWAWAIAGPDRPTAARVAAVIRSIRTRLRARRSRGLDMVGWVPLFLLVLRKLSRHRCWTVRLVGGAPLAPGGRDAPTPTTVGAGSGGAAKSDQMLTFPRPPPAVGVIQIRAKRTSAASQARHAAATSCGCLQVPAGAC